MQNDPSHLEDTEAIARVLEGDVNAFEVLVVKYRGLVFKIVRKHVPYQEAEETAQEVFVRAFQSLPLFKGKSGFKSWLGSIAVRTCYDFWRKSYKSREVPVSSLSESQKAWLEGALSERADRVLAERDSTEESRKVLDQALDRLTPEERIVLELIYLEGLSIREAAELTGWSMANVKVRSFRSRRRLRKIVEDLVG